MRKFIILFIILFSSTVYSEELPMFFDSGIDSYNFLAQDTTKELLENKKKNTEFGFSTYEFMLGNNHIIQFVVHPESLIYEVSEINVIEYDNRHLSNNYPNKAITHKGISLGISKEDLVRKIGAPAPVTAKRYEYKSEYDKAILKRYNMPLYYSSYAFVNNKLVSFSFGFEYP